MASMTRLRLNDIRESRRLAQEQDFAARRPRRRPDIPTPPRAIIPEAPSTPGAPSRSSSSGGGGVTVSPNRDAEGESKDEGGQSFSEGVFNENRPDPASPLITGKPREQPIRTAADSNLGRRPRVPPPPNETTSPLIDRRKKRRDD